MPDRLPSPSSSEQDPPPQGARGEGDGGHRGEPREPRQDDNPFAPPPEDAPDQPWQPRRPQQSDDDQQSGDGDGSRWSSRQPGRSSGGFGQRPGQSPDSDGQGNGRGNGMRWDPTDPAQRRARFALLAGMWAFFFALFNWPYVALLLGALGLNWGIGSLRAKNRAAAGPEAASVAAVTGDSSAQPAAGERETAGRPQTTAAISGIVTASLALAVVAATFTAQLVYRDYYTCVDDALTQASKQSCEQHLPKQLRPLLGDPD